MESRKPFYDPKFQAMSVTVLPGDFYTTDKADEMVVTILGSCVAACIRDKNTKLGGMNHFLLAEEPSGITSSSNRYGSNAMEQLINSILRKGGRREDLEIKLFGGANVIENATLIGTNNINFVRSYLKKENLKIVSEDLGGSQARRIHYWPSTGRVLRHLIQSKDDKRQQVVQEEKVYKENLRKKQEKSSDYGSIELFD